MITAKTVWNDIEKIRREAPLIHNITNYVVMNTTANALLAIGASPVMAHAVEEVEEMVTLAKALVVNIGTLSEKWIEAMVKAVRAAQQKGIPVVFDPVGVGATRFRTETAHKLLTAASPTIIRGNASEIRALATAEGITKGVDSLHGAEEALEAATVLSERYDCAVSISGETDIIVHKKSIARIYNGHALMPKVTGLGCTASALSGAFAAVNPSPFQAAAHAMVVMGVAGELAAQRSEGPATLQLHFLDSLYQLKEIDIQEGMRVKE